MFKQNVKEEAFTISPFYQSPFFRALLSMPGMACAISLFNKNKLNKNRLVIAATLILVTAGRIILVLPFCKQPRFEMNGLNWIIGGFFFGIAILITGGPLFLVQWWSPPPENRFPGNRNILKKKLYMQWINRPIFLGKTIQQY